MPFLALLSDRTPDTALPALLEAAPDLKIEPLSVGSLEHVLAIEPEAIVVDAGENAPQAWSVLTALRTRDARVPAVVIVERTSSSATPGTRRPTSSCTRARRRPSSGCGSRCSAGAPGPATAP